MIRIGLTLGVLGLAACGPDVSSDAPAPAEDGAEARTRGSGTFDSLTETLDRAKGVEERAERRADAVRRRIEADER